MGVQVGTVSMLYHAAIENIRAFLWRYRGLGMNPEVKTVEVVYSLPQSFPHGSQEPFYGFCLNAAFNRGNFAISNIQTNGFTEARRYSDVPGPPAEHAVENEGAIGIVKPYGSEYPFRPRDIAVSLFTGNGIFSKPGMIF